MVGNDLGKASRTGDDKKHMAAEVQERFKAVEEALFHVTGLYVKHVNISLTNYTLYMVLTN